MNIIDLHLDKSINKTDYPLEMQLSILEKEIDMSIVSGVSELRVIHGIGSGVLKNEVHRILSNHDNVLYYCNEYHPSYGNGSTIIIFK